MWQTSIVSHPILAVRICSSYKRLPKVSVIDSGIKVLGYLKQLEKALRNSLCPRVSAHHPNVPEIFAWHLWPSSAFCYLTQFEVQLWGRLCEGRTRTISSLKNTRRQRWGRHKQPPKQMPYSKPEEGTCHPNNPKQPGAPVSAFNRDHGVAATAGRHSVPLPGTHQSLRTPNLCLFIVSLNEILCRHSNGLTQKGGKAICCKTFNL